MDDRNVILEACGISKRFGGLRALDTVSVAIHRNSVHGIIGPNGAGKTTLFNLITGMLPPDSGHFEIEEKPVKKVRTHQLVSMGVSRTFQNIRLFKGMSVLENVMIGQHVHTPTAVFSIMINGRKSRSAENAAREEALAALDFVGLARNADQDVESLSYGNQRLVEFARALAAKPRILLLDEPAAGMNPTEKQHLLRLIGSLQQKSYTVVLIEHDMKVVMNICSTVSVLDHGKKLAEGRPADIRRHPEVIRAYLGKSDRGHA
jgi:branched-chain amino acid transport system ATP-binding protein